MAALAWSWSVFEFECLSSWATLALEADVHPKVVSERLGHSKIAITLDMYSQSVPSKHEEAATTAANLIRG
jgi:integrase